MKKIFQFASILYFIAIACASCSKSSNNKTTNGKLGSDFPPVLNSIITPAILDTLKQHGAVINSGLTPPTVSGIYLLHPNYCLFDNSGDNNAGTVFDDYKYKFSGQNTGSYTVSVQYKDIDSQDDGSDGSATYISGSGNLFTIFAETNGATSGVNYVTLQVISGEVQSGYIKNMQISTYLKSKSGDSGNNVIERIGSTRIFDDQDSNSASQTTFSVQKEVQSLGTEHQRALSFFSTTAHKN